MNNEEYRELELLRGLDKKKSQNNFEMYYRRMTGFTPAKHHLIICKALQALEDDKIDKLMVFLPPRSAKSTLCTQLFPSWYLGRHPREHVMVATHTQNYSSKTGRLVRNLFKHPLFPFDVELSKDSQAKHQWATNKSGEFNAFGALSGSSHGSAASILICDDLTKGFEAARSEVQSESVWDAYINDFSSRLQDRAKQIIITTRWAENDVPGRILPDGFDGKSGWYNDKETGERWYVLSIPAKAEHENDPCGRKIGEYLWEERFGEIYRTKEKRGGLLWAALYQQRPAPDEGLFFQAEHIKYYEQKDIDLSSLTIYITSDYAVTAAAGANDPDYTVHTVWGIDPEFNIYMLDMWRGRTTSDVWIERFINLVKIWKPLMAGEEQGQIIKGVGPFLVRQMRDERVFVHRKQYASATSKEQRAQSLLGMASMGKFFLPRGHPMTELFRSELLSFPAGKHDDMVDTATLLARMLADIISGTKKRGKDLSQGESLYELFVRNEEEQ